MNETLRNMKQLFFLMCILTPKVHIKIFSVKKLRECHGCKVFSDFPNLPQTLTQSFTEEKKGLDFSPRSGEATSGEK